LRCTTPSSGDRTWASPTMHASACLRPRSRAGTASTLLFALLAVGRIDQIMDGNAIVDCRAADRLGFGRFLTDLENLAHTLAWHEADAGFVSDHQVARLHPHIHQLDRAVDLHGFDAPLAGRRGELARPD